MKWPLLLLMPFGAFGAIENIRLQGVTPTQATLFYTAPDEGACRIEVSESASYTPLVHDVDPRLFAGSNSDVRSGSITDGRCRPVVIGRHGMMATGTRSAEPLAAASGWAYNWPSIVSPTSRAGAIVDPNTGVLIRKVTMPSDAGSDQQADSWPGGGVFPAVLSTPLPAGTILHNCRALETILSTFSAAPSC